MGRPASLGGMSELLLLVKFMSGCWSMERGSAEKGVTVIEEAWSRPRAGTLIGYGRTTRGERTLFHEFLRIEQRGDRLVYIARPSNAEKPTEFTSTKVSATEVVFENPEHDDPKRITYRVADGGLVAVTEGNRTTQFKFRRASCTEE
jgi:hypothetical protein